MIGLNPAKLPARSAAVPTESVYVLEDRSRSPSYPPKKKVLSRMIGPPTVKPNSLRLKGGLVGAKKFRAVYALLRLNSNAEPWI